MMSWLTESAWLLSLDTSGNRLQAGLWHGQQWHWRLDEVIDNQRTHSSLLLPRLQQAMEALDLSPSRLTALSVAIGPGSFTGLRAGVAVVRTLGQWLPHLTIYPVNTFDSWMAGWSEHLPNSWQQVGCALNARRGNFYHATYRRHGDLWHPDHLPEMRSLASLQPGTLDGYLIDPTLLPDWPNDLPGLSLETLPQLWTPASHLTLLQQKILKPQPWQDLLPLYLQPPNITLKKPVPTEPSATTGAL